jgi:short-subunit dehydrogenase
MTDTTRPLAVVTGASSGIGFELAKLCAENGFNLIIAADTPTDEAAEALRSIGVAVEVLETDLATREGVDALHALIGGRPVDYLLANAGHGLGRAFLDQDFDEIRHVIDTNITGTVYLTQLVTREMRARGEGRVLFTGSIAGFMPGAFSAVYNATKAFINSFSFALRNELKDSGVTITCLMPGATDTEFFARADELDTKVGTEEKDLAYDVARDGFEAMMAGKGDVVSGVYNKVMTAVSNVMPAGLSAEQHRRMAEPGTNEGS